MDRNWRNLSENFEWAHIPRTEFPAGKSEANVSGGLTHCIDLECTLDLGDGDG